MNQKDVVNVVAREREYQLRRWGFRQIDGSFVERKQTIEAFTLYMIDYVEEARKQLSREEYPVAYPKALATMLKVMALAVACFEQHADEYGLPYRDLSNITNGRDGQPA